MFIHKIDARGGLNGKSKWKLVKILKEINDDHLEKKAMISE